MPKVGSAGNDNMPSRSEIRQSARIGKHSGKAESTITLLSERPIRAITTAELVIIKTAAAAFRRGSMQDKEVNMEHVISGLLKRYEGGALSRRELVRGLAILAAAGGTASAAGFESSTLNHVSILVSDVPRSAAFYQRVFNLSVLDEDKAAPRIRLRLGKSSHLTIRRRSPAGTIDHFAIGIDHFNKDAVIRDLKQRGAAPQEGGDAGLHVKDPDGFDVQLTANEPG